MNEYAEYIAKNLNSYTKTRNIDCFSGYLAENLDRSIKYSEYIAENLGKTKGEIIREQRKEKLDNIFDPGTPGSSGIMGMPGTPGSSGTMGISGIAGDWKSGIWVSEYAKCHEIDELKSDIEIYEQSVKPKKVIKGMPVLRDLPKLRDLPEIRTI